MITVFVFVAIGALLGWFVIGRARGYYVDYVESAIMAFVCAVVFLLFGFLAAMVIGTFLPSEYVLDKQIELVEMQDTAGIQGKFFLSHSTINLIPRYVFYQKEGAGFGLDYASVKKTTVYEERRDDGLIKVYEKKFTAGWLHLIGFVSDEKYEIFVPQESILPQFHPDHPDSE